MQILAGLLALAVAAQAVVVPSTVPLVNEYKTGYTYKYEYTAHSMSGIPLVSNDRTGLTLWCGVNLHFHTETKVSLQVESPELRLINLEQPDQLMEVDRIPSLIESSDIYTDLPSDVKQTILSHLIRPITFTLDPSRGLVLDIGANQEEPEWCLNMKRAILNQFQMQYVDEVQHLTEDTIIGEECLVHYDIVKLDTTRRNVTKSFNLGNCVTTSSFRDVIGLRELPVKSYNDEIFRSTFVSKCDVTETNNRRFVINSCVSEGRSTLRPFSPQNGEMITFTRQELILKNEVRETIPVPTSIVRRSDSLFTFMESRENPMSDVYTDVMPETTKVTMIKNLMLNIVEKIMSDTNPTFEFHSTHEFMFATKLMRTLRLKTSFVNIVDFCFQPQHQDKMRPMMISALSFCGSPALVECLPTIRPKLTVSEFNIIITALPGTHVLCENTIRTLKQLYEDCTDENTCRQLLLTLGSEVHDFCTPVRSDIPFTTLRCEQTFRTEMKQYFEKKFLTTTSEIRQLIVLKAIGNSGLDMTDFLYRQIVSTSLSPVLRVNAIYALRRCFCEESEIRRVLLPVFRNEGSLFTPELRIAAFDVLIERIPTEQMLTVLVSNMNEESCRQVGNYVYSYLDNLINLPTVFDTTTNLIIAAQDLLPTVQRFEDGMWFSKNIKYIISSISYRMAIYLDTNVVYDPTQALPRSFNLRIVTAFFGQYMDLEAGFRFQGLDTLVKEWVTMLSPESVDIFSSLIGDRFRREIVHIQSILNEEDISDKPVEETRGYIFLKHLSNELGVWTTEDFTLMELKERVTSWMTSLDMQPIRYLNAIPLAQMSIKVQSLIGMPVVFDYSAMWLVSLHSDVIDTSAIMSRSITPRLMMHECFKTGIDIGLLRPSVAVVDRLNLVTPLVFRLNAENSMRYSVEISVDTHSPLMQTQFLEYSTLPLCMTEFLRLKDNSYMTHVRNLNIHKLIMPYKYETEYYGVGMVVEGRDFTQWTYKLPLFPMSGRYSFRMFWTREPKPFGLKTTFRVDTSSYKTFVTFVLNPAIENLNYELTLIGSYFTPRDTPCWVFSLEVEPKWMDQVYRMFVTYEMPTGRINPAFSWINAAEEKPVTIEYVLKSQWGWNIQYEPTKQDIVVKTTLKKSDLQKMFEVEENLIEDSDCYKCEKSKDFWRNVVCDRCIFKRSWLSRIDSRVFINSEKMYTEDYVMPWITYYLYPYYNMWESGKVVSSIESDMIRTDRSLLSTTMPRCLQSGTVIPFRVMHDIHPYFTEHNVTVLYDNMRYVFTHLPLLPSNRRIYNLPVNRLTDVATDRFTLPQFGKCTIDSRCKVHTLDTVMYDLPKTQECEQVLVKDCTHLKQFEVTTRQLTNSKRTLTIRLPETVVEIVPVTPLYEVRVNNVVKPWVKDVVETERVRIVRVPVVTPTKTTEYKLTVYVKMPTYMHFTLFNDLVNVELPFWYRSRVCGLCGDFNGEFKAEFQLPDMSIATSLPQFIESYTAPTCRDTIRHLRH